MLRMITLALFIASIIGIGFAGSLMAGPSAALYEMQAGG
jgi:hypothetical protein